MNKSAILALSAAMVFAASIVAECASPLPVGFKKKKYIVVNSGGITPKVLRENIRTIEAQTPAQGLEISLIGKGRRDGKNVNADPVYDIFTSNPWQEEWFQEELDNLKNTDFKQFTDIFIRFSCRGNLEWFDDAGWAQATKKIAMLAKFAKENKCVGLRMDPEFYGNQTKMSFKFDPALGHSYDETWQKARQRGRDFMAAAAQVYPDMKLLIFFGLSVQFNYAKTMDPYHAMSNARYALFYGFLNGMYDAMTPQMLIIDGNETAGYRAQDETAYFKAYAEYKAHAWRLLAPENQSKWLQTSLGTSIYLDAYFHDNKHSWDIAPNLDFNAPERLAMFERNLGYAGKWSDEYIWIYGEVGRWWSREHTIWSWGKLTVKYWEDFAPGFVDAVRRVTFPNNVAIEATGTNILRNPAFNEPYDKAKLQKPVVDHYPCEIMGWNLYKGRNKSGAFKPLSDGALEASGFIGDACLSQRWEANPGDTFHASAKVKVIGKGNATLQGFFVSGDRWFWATQPPAASPAGDVRDGWETLSFTMELPNDLSITGAGIGLMVSSQNTKDSKIIFSNVHISKLRSGSPNNDILLDGHFKFDVADKTGGMDTIVNVVARRRFFSDQFIRVNPNLKYTISGDFRSDTGTDNAPLYFGFAPFDSDRKPIKHIQVDVMPGTKDNSFLAADIKPSDTSILVTNASQWLPKNYAHLAYAMPGEESPFPNPHYVLDSGVSSCKLEGKDTWRITFTKPLGISLKAGTKVWLAQDGGAFNYLFIGHIGKDWTTIEKSISGISNGIEEGKWWTNTAYFKVLVMTNWTTPGATLNNTQFKNIKVNITAQ